MRVASSVVIATLSAIIGALAQSFYAAHNLDLESRMLGAPPIPFREVLPLILLLTTVQLAIGGPLLHAIARKLGGRGTLADSIRAVALGTTGALGKLVPWIGYFVAVALTLGLLVVFVRRAHELTYGRAALATATTTALLLTLVAIGVAATIWLR